MSDAVVEVLNALKPVPLTPDGPLGAELNPNEIYCGAMDVLPFEKFPFAFDTQSPACGISNAIGEPAILNGKIAGSGTSCIYIGDGIECTTGAVVSDKIAWLICFCHRCKSKCHDRQ
jgi:hypothetical protein